jgi:fumarate hydratase class II
LDLLEETFVHLSEKYADLVKIGRTHLQDAVPLTLGQEIGGWAAMLAKTKGMITDSLKEIRGLALGGTAVGTGLNTHPKFGEMTAEKISLLTGTQFFSSTNKFYSLSSKSCLVFTHGALKALATDMLKIANDVRWLASGPRCGIGELKIPANEPGSSIMPGKVNPTQCEAMSMVCCQVISNDVAVGFAASQGNFQLNVYMPVITLNLLQSIRLLGDALRSFNDKCAVGITPNTEKMEQNVKNSFMLVTALSPKIGYGKSAKIAQFASQENLTLRQAAVKLGYLTEKQYDEAVDPSKMAWPHR